MIRGLRTSPKFKFFSTLVFFYISLFLSLFLTRKKMALSHGCGGAKEFHVFISYRVSSDADLAEKICDKLQQHSVGNDQNCRQVLFLLSFNDQNSFN